MKRLVIVTLLALALPILASANSITIVNVGGTISGSTSGLTLTNSTLVAYGGIVGTNLGTVSFTTGALLTGSLQMGGTFAAGGSFIVKGNGTGGVPNGTIFKGTFADPVNWVLITNTDGTHSYKLEGVLNGTGQGATTQLTINVGKGFFTGKPVRVASGDTNIVTPEPGTLGLLATGLVGVAGAVRRRFARV